MDDLEMMRAMGLPVDFGSSKKAAKKGKDVVFGQIKAKKIGEKPAAQASTSTDNAPKEQPNGTAEDEDEFLGEKETQDLADAIPTHRCSLSNHSRAVTALSIDPKCARMISGGRDNTVQIWDFAGMISTLKPFLSIEPAEGNPIRSLSWSNSGDSFLVAPSTSTPILFDRNGIKVCLFSRGDMYIRDLRNVFGHTSGLTGIQFVPFKVHSFVTSSLDSTVRIWDIEHRTKSIAHFFLPGKKAGEKYGMTCSSVSSNGKLIASGDTNGRIMVWDMNGKMCKPAHVFCV
jgi:WD40 repeat protein